MQERVAFLRSLTLQDLAEINRIRASQVLETERFLAAKRAENNRLRAKLEQSQAERQDCERVRALRREKIAEIRLRSEGQKSSTN